MGTTSTGQQSAAESVEMYMTDLRTTRPLLQQTPTMEMEVRTGVPSPTVKNKLSPSPYYSVVAATLVFLLIIGGSILFGLYYHHQATHSRKEYARLLEKFKSYNKTLAHTIRHESRNITRVINVTADDADELQKMNDSFEKIIAEKNEQIERLMLHLGMLGSHPELLKSDIDIDMSEGVGLLETFGNNDNSKSQDGYSSVDNETQAEKEFARIKSNLTNELFTAIDRNDWETVQLLVDSGADVNGLNNKSESLLHRAAECKNGVGFKIIKTLIDNGADARIKDEEDYTFLHKLVDDGTVLTPHEFHVVAEYLISKNLTQLFNTHGSFYKIFDTPRWSYLYRLSTTFHMAVKNLEIEMATLTLLHDNGVNFNSINSNDDSILFYALMGKRSTQFLSNLVQLGANWEHLNNYNSSLLHRAAVFGSSKEELKFFLDLGLDINSVNAYDNTPLHLVVSWNNGIILEMVQFLIENGADVELKDNYGRTALDIALVRSNMINRDKIVDLLRISLESINKA